MKTTRKLLALILTLALVCSLLGTIPASADDANKCGDDLYWSWDESTATLHISGSGPMWDFEDGEAPWAFLNDPMSDVGESEIRALVLDKGITSIGSYAFSGCGALTNVTIPEGVTSIGDCAFQYCYILNAVRLPDSLRTIGEYAFFECNLYELSLPSGLTDIGGHAFAICFYLHEVTIPQALEHLGPSAFDPDYVDTVKIAPGNTHFYFGDNHDLYCRSGKDVTLVECFSRYDHFDVPEGVTAIGPEAFCYQYCLVAVTFPDSVKTLGDNAFQECWALHDLTLPNGLTSIGKGCFSNCETLESLRIPDSVTDIGSYAFYYCWSLCNIELPKGLTQIPDGAFMDCPNLLSVAIPAGVTVIGESAFEDAGLIDIDLPAGLTSIGKNAFASTYLCEVTLPASLTYLGEGAFSGCNEPMRITVEPGNPNISTDSKNVVYYQNGGERVLLKAPLDLTSYAVPDGVTAIGDGAFLGCDRLRDLTLPDSVHTIGADAFYGCEQLKSFKLPEGLKTLGDRAFNYCRNIRELTFPAGISEAGYEVFDRSGLEKVTFSEGTVRIPDSICTYCETLEEIVLPGTVTEIGSHAFENCFNLYELALPEGIKKIGDYAFYNCTELIDIRLPSTLEEIGTGAFEYCDHLRSVSIPEGVTTIGYGAFCDCARLRSLTIPASVSEIGSNFLRGCRRLETLAVSAENPHYCTDEAGCLYRTDEGKTLIYAPCILTACTIPEGVTAIGPYAFCECGKLQSVTLPEGLTSIGEFAFYECDALENVTLPDSVTSIGRCAFSYCPQLCELQLPEGLTNIDDYAFAMSGIRSIDIPGTVERIGYYAFEHTPLTSATIADGVETISDTAFAHCPLLTCVNLPASVDFVQTSVFYGCGSLRDIFFAGTEDQWYKIAPYGLETSSYELHITFGTTHSCPAAIFRDAPFYDSWAHEGIDYCIDEGLMNGVSETAFNPNGNVTRAQLVTILYRMAGQPEIDSARAAAFTDVPAEQWYSDAIAWASANGIVNGVGENRFNPMGAVTREQIATILFRYAGADAGTGSIASFPDADAAHSYALDALAWAARQGIITGVSTNGVTYLKPQNNATRAQIAAIIMRFAQSAE